MTYVLIYLIVGAVIVFIVAALDWKRGVSHTVGDVFIILLMLIIWPVIIPYVIEALLKTRFFNKVIIPGKKNVRKD